MIKKLAEDSIYYSYECTKCNRFLFRDECDKCGDKYPVCCMKCGRKINPFAPAMLCEGCYISLQMKAYLERNKPDKLLLGIMACSIGVIIIYVIMLIWGLA